MSVLFSSAKPRFRQLDSIVVCIFFGRARNKVSFDDLLNLYSVRIDFFLGKARTEFLSHVFLSDPTASFFVKQVF